MFTWDRFLRSTPQLLASSIVLAFLFVTAPLALAGDPPACVDGDLDGFVECDGICDPGGNTCDCAVAPVTNLNDPMLFFPGASCAAAGNGPGGIDLVNGPCFSAGVIQCNADGSGTQCVQCTPDGMGGCIPQGSETPVTYGDEPPGGDMFDSACTDGRDNDCSGLIDREDPACTLPTELLCDGIDDDFNMSIDEGFGLGNVCTVGVGFCERTGVLVCDALDPSQSTCSVSAGFASTEDTPGMGKCVDGVDNDCDGLVDLADPSCQMAEICDGLDNDGNTLIDEGFPDLGQACSAGVGACLANGVKVCSPDGGSTLCTAVASVASVEGPIGPTCNDGIDNDCDGSADMMDASCNPDLLSVSCALPFTHGEPGNDCNGKHQLVVETAGASQDAVLSVEVLGLDMDGNVLAALPANDGDEVHLASRLKGNVKASTKSNKKGTSHQMFAPVPLVRATLNDGGIIKQAYCSNIPYLDVVQPSGNVVSASEGDVTLVTAAIPFVDPSTLQVLVDGVDILAEMGIDPAMDFTAGAFGPFDGSVTIDGQLVEVQSLELNTALDFFVPSPNTLTMTLENLGGGGHIVFVDGEAAHTLPPVAKPAAACHVDDVQDSGTVSVFAITIDSPMEGDVTNLVPTPVLGEVLHGREIRRTVVNGMDQDVNAQMCTLGDGMTSADECALPINTSLGQTNLSTGSAGGTFDRGQNDVLAGAEDDLGNLTFARQRFIVGDTIAPEVSAAASQLLLAEMEAAAKASVHDNLIMPLNAGGFSLENAMALGITADGLQTFFDSTCKKATEQVKAKIEDLLLNFDIPDQKIDDVPFFVCSPTAKFPKAGRSVSFAGDLTCDVTPQTDQVHVSVGIPDFTAVLEVRGGCRTEFLGVCVSEIIIDSTAEATLSDFALTFDITEDLALAGGEALSDFIDGTITPDVTRAENEVNCTEFVSFLFGGIVGLLVDVIFDPLNGLINAAAIKAELEGIDIAAELRKIEQDPLKVQEFDIDEISAELQSKLGFVQEIADVQIEPEGLTATLGASWEVQTPFPGLEDATSTDTVAPGPTFPIPGLGDKDAFFALSDDLFGVLYAALTVQGALQTDCVDSGLTVLDILPADCSTLTGMNAIDEALQRGRCHGAQMQVACDSLPLGQRAACTETRSSLQDRNIAADTDLLFCARRGIAPRLLIEDDPSTMNAVEVTQHFNDLKITIVLDREADLTLGQPFATTLACSNALAGNVADCKWADACFDVDVQMSLSLGMSSDANPQFEPGMADVQDDPPGMQCGGGSNFGSDMDLLTRAGAADPIEIVAASIDALTPLFEPEGFDLGGFVAFMNAMTLAIETLAEPDCPTCQEYAGISVELELPPP